MLACAEFWLHGFSMDGQLRNYKKILFCVTEINASLMGLEGSEGLNYIIFIFGSTITLSFVFILEVGID